MTDSPRNQGLAELHVHFQGCITPRDLLRHLATCDGVLWDWYESNFREVFGQVPQARELVERFRAGDTSAELEFEQVATFSDDDMGSFDRFGAKNRIYWAGAYLGNDRDSLEQEYVQYATGIRAELTRHGVRYVEMRVGAYPWRLEALDREPDPLTLRVALSWTQDDLWSSWEQVEELVLGPHGHRVTAIDFCGREEGHPPRTRAPFFNQIKDFNERNPERALAILYHVGESFDDKSLESAIRWVHEAAELGVNRLGHAIALGVDPALYGAHVRTESVAERRDQIAYDLLHCELLRAAGVPIDPKQLDQEFLVLESMPDDSLLEMRYDQERLEGVRRRQDFAMRYVRSSGAIVEVCPTSNRRIGNIRDPAHHPVHRFLSHGVPFVVCSDNPGLLGTTLARELDWVCEQTGGGESLRRELVEMAWRSRSEVMARRPAPPS